MQKFALWLLLLVAGCGGGGFQSQVRHALALSARSLVVVDRTSAELYTQAAEESLQVATDARDYRRRMAEYDELETVLRAARFALLGAEAGVDVLEETGEQRELIRSIACLSGVLSDIADRLATITGERYAALTGPITALEALGGTCDDGITN